MKNRILNTKKSIIFSTVINYAVFVIVAVCFVIGLFNDSMTETGRILSGWTIIRFFTVQSNVFIGITCLIYAIFETRVLTGSLTEVPRSIAVLKHVFSVSVAVTFLTVALYLSPINKAGYFALFEGTNFFFHFLVPVLACVTLIIFDWRRMPFSYTLFGLIPFLSYGIFYVVNAFTHLQGGVVSPEYDWYYLLQGGTVACVISIFVMTAMTYLTSVLLWLPNRK